MGAMKQYQMEWMEFEELYGMVFDEVEFDEVEGDEDLAIAKLVREQADSLHDQYLQPGSPAKLGVVVQALHELQVCYPAITRALAQAKKQEAQYRQEFLARLERDRQQVEQQKAKIPPWLLSPDQLGGYLGDPPPFRHVVDIEGSPLPGQTNGDPNISPAS